MKKTLLLLLFALFASTQINAQVAIPVTKSGYVQNTSSTNTQFYDANIKLKGLTDTWSRVGYIEAPITVSSEAGKVELMVSYYKSSATGEFPIEFFVGAGELPADLGFINQPAESGFTRVDSINVDGETFGWLSLDITAEYNAALANGETAVFVKMVSNQLTSMLELYSNAATVEEDRPYLSVNPSLPVVVEATKSGYVQNTSTTNTIFYTNVIKAKGLTDGWSRIGYVEVPVTETSEPSEVHFNVNYYKVAPAGEYPLEIFSMPGELPADIGFITQPDENSFTRLDTMGVTDSDYGMISLDITDEYIAAMQANETALSFKILSNQVAAVLEFNSIEATDEAVRPHLSVLSNCPPEYNDVEFTLTAGESYTVGDQTITESGVYRDTSETDCGAEKVDTYYILFITEGTVTNDVAICDGSSYEVQTGPNSFTNYTEAGSYTDVIKSDDDATTQTSITNITINSLPEPQALGDDTSIREGEQLTLDAGPGFAAYQWYNNNVAVVDETAQTVVVESAKEAFTFGTNSITVEVTDDNGCVGASALNILVDIVGNFVAPSKDMFLEEAGDRLLDISRLEVKFDTWGDVSSDVPVEPFYTKETYLSFDLTDADLPENAENFKLQLFMYAVDANVRQATPDTTVTINCDYIDGQYDDGLIWTTRPAAASKTPLASALTVNPSMKNDYVEFDINEIFESDILGTKDEFTIVLSITNDAYSILAKFRDLSNSKVELRPALTFELIEPSSVNALKEELSVRIMPNPVQNELLIESEHQFEQARVYNMLGSLVLSSEINDNRIDMSSLIKGQYIISLISKDRKVNELLIKQ